MLCGENSPCWKSPYGEKFFCTPFRAYHFRCKNQTGASSLAGSHSAPDDIRQCTAISQPPDCVPANEQTPDILHGSDQGTPAISRFIAFHASMGIFHPQGAQIEYQIYVPLSTVIFIFSQKFLYNFCANQTNFFAVSVLPFFRPELTDIGFFRTIRALHDFVQIYYIMYI